ncbi:hypothetical protein FDUTEX481_00788 [Tolypothrix sp. PCC 7601]|nr:hypothetical protein FDUTEX481_00788 [Tolypothrix sp. PCC 7601]
MYFNAFLGNDAAYRARQPSLAKEIFVYCYLSLVIGHLSRETR